MVQTKILQPENSRTLLVAPCNVQNIPKKLPQFIVSVIAMLIALCMGMCLVWTSPALPMLQNQNYIFKITKIEGAWIGSLLTLGACVGAVPTGSIANIIGRKRTLQIISIPLFLHWILIAYGKGVWALYIARFLAGAVVGSISVAAPMYVAEIAHISIRGTLGTFFQVFITLGILSEYMLGATISSFFLLALTSSIFPLVFFTLYAFMPETPVFLYAKGRVNEAKNSLQFLRGKDYNVEDELVKISEDVKEMEKNKSKLNDLVKSRVTINALIIAMLLMAFQQLSGINAVLFYTAPIFQETGSSLSPDICAILVGVVQVIGSLLSALLIDKLGRKLLLFLSAFIMCVSLISLGVYFDLKQTHDLSNLTVIPLVCLALFIVMFSVGLGPIPWFILGEIFTPKTKGVASSVSVAFNWILAFTVTNQYQNLNDSLGVGLTFVVFGVICGLGALCIALVVPETKNRNVDQVQKVIMRNLFLNCSRREDVIV